MVMSENRQTQADASANVGRPLLEIAVSVHAFHLERVPTPTGAMLIVSDDEQRLRAVDWEDHEERMWRLLGRRYGKNAVALKETPRTSAAKQALDAYFEGDFEALTRAPVAANGTPFQSEVWAALRQIPTGATISYGALAIRIGRPKAVRAVGLANGANPIALFVPCHRVIGADASLTGYGGGLDRKRWLLAHEGGAVPLLQKVQQEIA
jgi:methylated-DNA-[protein]-cysteine S-methyltransferase